MNRRLLITGSVLLVFAVLGAAAAADPIAPAALDFDADIAKEINRMRRELGLKALRTDRAALTAAAAYAEKVAAERRFSHIDSEGNRAVRRYRAAGGVSLVAGEVLGKGPDLEAVVNAWRESRDHIALILHPLWTHMGVGSASLPGGETVYVVVFTEKHLCGIDVTFLEDGVRIEGTVCGVVEPAAELNGEPVNITMSELSENGSAGTESAGNGGEGSSTFLRYRFVIHSDENALLYFFRFGYIHADGFPVFTESYRFERP